MFGSYLLMDYKVKEKDRKIKSKNNVQVDRGGKQNDDQAARAAAQ